ncbi:MAG TPA: 3'-5' exonuclease, partial [Fimbriimonadaceae bacterium]|nr:3'-5' exonuclease [Fimbriimonadaceae bacterium]
HSPIVGLSLDSIVLLADGGNVWSKIQTPDEPAGSPPEKVSSVLDEDPLTQDSTPVLEVLPEQDRIKLADFQSWFEPLHAYADRIPAWEILATILARAPYLTNLATRFGGVQTIANVRKLLSIAAGMPGETAPEFSRRMREIQEIRHLEGDAPASDDETNQVTILTVHKAKGLEFPVVVVPDVHGKIRPQQEVEIDRSGLTTVKFGKVDSVYHTFNVHWRKERDQEELYRLLYVALTRAKRRLCLVVNPGGPTNVLAGDIPDWMGWNEGMPEGLTVRRASGSAVAPNAAPDETSD